MEKRLTWVLKTIDDLIPAENIEGIEVKKEAGGKGEIYITTKKTKAVEKTIAKGNMKVEGKVVDEQGEPVIGAAVLIEGTLREALPMSMAILSFLYLLRMLYWLFRI